MKVTTKISTGIVILGVAVAGVAFAQRPKPAQPVTISTVAQTKPVEAPVVAPTVQPTPAPKPAPKPAVVAPTAPTPEENKAAVQAKVVAYATAQGWSANKIAAQFPCIDRIVTNSGMGYGNLDILLNSDQSIVYVLLNGRMSDMESTADDGTATHTQVLSHFYFDGAGSCREIQYL